jgi:hypothetical protein
MDRGSWLVTVRGVAATLKEPCAETHEEDGTDGGNTTHSSDFGRKLNTQYSLRTCSGGLSGSAVLLVECRWTVVQCTGQQWEVSTHQIVYKELGKHQDIGI